ncbi:hypothetical protein EXN66_Car005122 [Channa argus]|uniref:Uncharacterized protein n=1 Tax=Channa argus TaxID=215402 RepID=A0A6G1PGM0_CHAAH|nr:hypothetical protein EXN66_Car005122 [Channa argus]
MYVKRTVLWGKADEKRISADRKEEMKTDSIEFVRQQQHMMLQKASVGTLKGRLVITNMRAKPGGMRVSGSRIKTGFENNMTNSVPFEARSFSFGN